MSLWNAYVNTSTLVLLLAASRVVPLGAQQPPTDPKRTEVWSPIPRVVTPGVGTAPPSDAIVLFDGRTCPSGARPTEAPLAGRSPMAR